MMNSLMTDEIRKYKYSVTFYLNDEEVDTVFIDAPDPMWAIQTLLLMINSKKGIPGIYNSYSEPELIQC